MTPCCPGQRAGEGLEPANLLFLCGSYRSPAILVTPRGRLVTVITFRITSGKIVAIGVIADAERLGQLIIKSRSLAGAVDHA
jgi:hypothetical protein